MADPRWGVLRRAENAFIGSGVGIPLHRKDNFRFSLRCGFMSIPNSFSVAK